MREVVVEGPCTLKVTEGRVRVLGIPVEKGEDLKLPPKTFTLIIEDNTSFQMDCKVLGEVNLGWDRVAEEIAASGGKVLLLGSTDSGKTYFSTLLSNLSPSYLVDGDVGQSSLFLPGFVSSAKVTGRHLTLEQGAEELEFFGGITPSLNYRLHANLVSSLVERSKERVTVVDTDGWFRGLKAMLHKFELTLRVDPDFIVTFDEGIKDRLPTPYRKRVVSLRKVGLTKDPERRRKNRAEKFKEYFSNAKVHVVPLEDFLGERVTDLLLNAWGEYVQLVDETPCVGYRVDIEGLKGALLGVVRKGKVVGAGLLLSVEDDQVKFLSKADEVDGVVLGSIALAEDFAERPIPLEKC